MVRHAVYFSFKALTSAEEIQIVVDAFAQLQSEIKEIASFEWGLNQSHEGKSRGLTHCFLLTFKNFTDRDRYLVHPAHTKFGALVRPLYQEVLVTDWEC